MSYLQEHVKKVMNEIQENIKEIIQLNENGKSYFEKGNVGLQIRSIYDDKTNIESIFLDDKYCIFGFDIIHLGRGHTIVNNHRFVGVI